VIEVIFCVLIVLTMWVWVRALWATRRQPVRRTAPTGTEPWVRPAPRRYQSDPPR
jgi:hypothetical protein